MLCKLCYVSLLKKMKQGKKAENCGLFSSTFTIQIKCNNIYYVPYVFIFFKDARRGILSREKT